MTDSIGTETAYLLPYPADAASRPPERMWQDGDGPSFADLIDIINPLQHLPIISTIYRAITGDEIGLGARLAGGALYGGPLGVVLTGATAALEEATGGTMSDTLASLFHGDDAPPVAVASAAPATAPPAPPRQAAALPDPEPADRAPVRARLEAQRAQARLLFSRLLADTGNARAPAPAASSPPEHRPARPQRASHPLLPPADAPPDWYLQAMERAFRKYQGDLRARAREGEQDTARRAFTADRGTI